MCPRAAGETLLRGYPGSPASIISMPSIMIAAANGQDKPSCVRANKEFTIKGHRELPGGAVSTAPASSRSIPASRRAWTVPTDRIQRTGRRSGCRVSPETVGPGGPGNLPACLIPPGRDARAAQFAAARNASRARLVCRQAQHPETSHETPAPLSRSLQRLALHLPTSAMIRRLFEAGADRLPHQYEAIPRTTRCASWSRPFATSSPATARPIGILVDLQGPKTFASGHSPKARSSSTTAKVFVLDIPTRLLG